MEQRSGIEGHGASAHPALHASLLRLSVPSRLGIAAILAFVVWAAFILASN
jgi:hypothetical protein